MLADFQYATDMAKRGELRQGFVVLWRRQHLLVAAVITALAVLVLAPAVRAVMSRRPRAAGPRRRAKKGDS